MNRYHARLSGARCAGRRRRRRRGASVSVPVGGPGGAAIGHLGGFGDRRGGGDGSAIGRLCRCGLPSSMPIDSSQRRMFR